MEKVVTTIRLPETLKEQLHREATEKGYSIKDLIMFILYYHFHEAILPE